MLEDSGDNYEPGESLISLSTMHSGATLHTARAPVALIGLVFATSLFFSGCSAKQTEQAPTVAAQVGTAETEAIQRKVNADAIIYPLDQAAIVPKITAPVKRFYVDKGSVVHAGQLLADLENQDLAGAVTDSQGGLVQAQAAYDAAVQKAQQDLELAKQVLDGAQKLYDTRQSLYKQGAVSAKDVDDASVSLTQARDEYETAQKQLDLKIAGGQLASAKGKSTSAEAEFSYSRITSPINGVVTDRPVYPGETPPAGSPVITVMNLSEVVAHAHVSQQEANLMKVGDSATISLPGETETKGKVTLVSPGLDSNSTTVEIWVQAPNPKGEFKAGASARMTVVTQTVPQAIVIPAVALLTDSDGTTSVMVLDSANKPHKQKVTVGIRDADEVQITEGLKGGERVVTDGAFQLYNEDDDVLAKTTVQVQAPKPTADDNEDNAK